MNCVVFGSNGFVGSHLYNKLNALGHKVSRGDREGNVPKYTDWVFDLASYGNIYGQFDQKMIYDVIVNRFKRILKQSGSCKAIVATSSSSVNRPLTDYALAKLKMEEIATKSELPIVVVRPSSVVGVGEQDVHLIPLLIGSCLNGYEMPFVSEPVHDFIDVNDVVEAYILLAMNISTCGGRVFNVSSGMSISNELVKDLVELVTGRKANLRMAANLRPYDGTDWIVDNSEVKSLGWKPKLTIVKSIQSMVSSICAKEDLPGMRV